MKSEARIEQELLLRRRGIQISNNEDDALTIALKSIKGNAKSEFPRQYNVDAEYVTEDIIKQREALLDTMIRQNAHLLPSSVDTADNPKSYKLDLSIENLTKIPPEILNMEQITDLHLRGTTISDFNILSDLVNLRAIDLDWSENQSIELSEVLEGVANLSVRGGKIKDLIWTNSLPNLRALDLSGTDILSLNGIECLTNLETLIFRNTDVNEIVGVGKLKSLKTLDLSGTKVSDITPISKLKDIVSLNFSATNVSDVSPVRHLGHIQAYANVHSGGIRYDNIPALRENDTLKNFSTAIDNSRTRAILEVAREAESKQSLDPSIVNLPTDRPLATTYFVPNNGPIQATGDPIGPNDPEQQAIQDECREKIRALIGSVREGDNELAPLVEAATKYRDLIDRPPTDILATTLWSAANTLRARHEAHKSADEQARLNDMLPPQTAAALQDLLETHGVFFLGHPGAAEVERKRREFLSGPRNPDARGAADKLATSLVEHPEVLDPEAASPLELDNETARGEGRSAQMAETSLFDSIRNVAAAIARKIWSFTKTKTGVSIDAIIGAEVASWWIANKSIFVSFYKYLETNVPAWLTWLVNLF